MGWTERQRAMLREMGIRWWAPEDGSADHADASLAVALAEPPPAAGPTVVRPPVDEAPTARAGAIVVPPTPLQNVVGFDAVARMDWSTLRDTVAGCTSCRLCEGRRQTVFGVGHERAHWMVVGEAPGEQEDRQGEPFVGVSGQLLDNMLRAIGLTRAEAPPAQQVYIANTVKCRPPGNRNPEPDELATCEAYLVRQVQLVQPKIILAMGRFAVQSLLRSSEPVGRLRGRVHRYQGVPLIVTYHPAYLLRNLEDKAKAWDDLCLAVETLRAEGGEPAAG